MKCLPALRIDPVRLRLKAENPCTAGQCEVPAAGVLAYLSSGWRTVELRPVCGGHAQALRALGGCVVFPLKAVPPMETILAAVNTEIARRRRPQPTATFVFNMAATSTAGTFTWGAS